MSEAGEAVPSADVQVGKVFAWRRGFNAMFLIDLGVKLGLFRALADAPARPTDLANKLGLHEPYVATWCLTAYGFELLDAAADGAYRLAPHFDTILASPGHPRYLGGYAKLGTDFASEDFRALLGAFRDGGKIPFQGRSDAFAEVIAESTAGLHFITARKILPELPGLAERLAAGACLVELGCGVGRLLLALAKANPQAQIRGVDIDPTGLRRARQALATAGYGERVQVLEGELGAVIAPRSADALVMVEVLHEIAQPIRPRVLRACGEVLKPGGWIVILDETYPSTLAEARAPEFAFPLQTGFEELLWGNIIPTREEQERLLNDAGFEPPQRSLLGEGFTLLTARKR